MSKITVGIIGGGNMGAAIAVGIQKSFSVCICEKDRARQAFLKKNLKVAVLDLADLIAKSNVIILAVKPQDFDATLQEVRKSIAAKKLVVSIAAGITSAYIEKRLGAGIRVVRTMPNLPAQVGEGMTGLCAGKRATRLDVALALKIFNCIGQTVIVQERQINAITAVSGSGPAYVFFFVELFTQAAKQLGFNDSQARKLVAQTLKGSLKLLEAQGGDAKTLRERVTSKKGTTEAALKVFAKKKFGKTFESALKAAEKRARKLSQ